jgi:hypothetical protein
VREATVDLQNYKDVNRGNRSLLRTDLKIRVSGRKANRLICQMVTIHDFPVNWQE